MNNFIKQEIHRPKPVTIERDVNDVIVIEGVRYHGDLFRAFSLPESDVLYSVRRDEDDVVRLTVIRNLDEAKEFFDPHPALPQIGEEHPDLGEEGQDQEQGEDDGL